MYKSIEQNKGRVVDWDGIQWDTPRRHVRRLQERIFRATRKYELKEHGDVYGFLRREPRAGKLARGVPRRGGGSNTTSLFNKITIL